MRRSLLMAGVIGLAGLGLRTAAAPKAEPAQIAFQSNVSRQIAVTERKRAEAEAHPQSWQAQAELAHALCAEAEARDTERVKQEDPSEVFGEPSSELIFALQRSEILAETPEQRAQTTIISLRAHHERATP